MCIYFNFFNQPLHDRAMEPLHKMLKHEMHTKDNCVHFVNLDSLQLSASVVRDHFKDRDNTFHY